MSRSTSQRAGAVALLVAAAAALGATSYVVVGYWRAITITLMGACLGPTLELGLEMLARTDATRVRRILAALLFTGLTAATSYSGYRLWSLGRRHTYPYSDGMLADFTGGSGSPARTAFGTQLSMFSDNAYNLRSHLYYRRIDDPAVAGEGFLRLFFELRSEDDRQPYVGIYADMSPPPPCLFDVSRFRTFSMKVRLGQPLDESRVSVGVVLYSSNVVSPEYAFATHMVDPRDLTTDWVKIKADFGAFGRPAFHRDDVRLDPTGVYRVGLLVTGTPGALTHGHVDFDELRFEP